MSPADAVCNNAAIPGGASSAIEPYGKPITRCRGLTQGYRFTTNAWVFAGAGSKLALPDWLAVSDHVPGATSVSRFPATRQIVMSFETTVNGSPELAVAEMVKGAAPNVWLAILANAIVCG